MTDALTELGRWSVAGLWLPMGAWTVAGGLALSMLGLRKRLHPLTAYRLRQAVLLALPTTLLFAWWLPGPTLFMGTAPVFSIGAEVLSQAGTTPATVAKDLAAVGNATSAGAPLGVLTVFSALLGLIALWPVVAGLFRLRRIERSLRVVEDESALRTLEELCQLFDVRRPVRLVLAEGPVMPMTFGSSEPTIVVPGPLLDDERALRGVLAHELVHVRRRDFESTVIEEALGALFICNPLAWVCRRSIAAHREASCDAEVVARGPLTLAAYGALLVEFATTHAGAPAFATPIITSTSTIRRRLETMERFKAVTTRNSPRHSLLAAAGTVLVLAGIGACASPQEAPREAVEQVSMTQQKTDRPLDGESLQRLELEMQYLETRIDSVLAEASEQHSDRLVRQYEMLMGLYQVRLEHYEVIRMEQEMARQMGAS